MRARARWPPAPSLTARRAPPPLPPLSLDTSDFMRNGDYTPSRMESQHDAVTMAIGGKLNANPENTVGLLAYGGKG